MLNKKYHIKGRDLEPELKHWQLQDSLSTKKKYIQGLEVHGCKKKNFAL